MQDGRLKLLMTCDAVGGVWTYVLDLAAGLSALGIDCVLAVLGPEPRAEQCAAAEAVPGLVVERIDRPLDWTAADRSEVEAAQAAIEAAIRRHGPDVVQVNSAALAAGLEGLAPLVVACHSCVATWWEAVKGGPLPHDFQWRKAMAAEGLAAADAVVAPSAAFARMTASVYGLEDRPITVHNGRRTANPRKTRPRLAPGFVFTAGRLWDDGKDAATLDRAAALIEGPVVAAGALAGPNGTKVRFANLRCIGQVPDAMIAGWLSGAPVFVSMARYEPFGLVVLEAAQAGCPLILGDTPVFRELWDGAAAFVPCGDEHRLAGIVNAILRDPAGRARLGAAARMRASRYAADRMAREMASIYRTLASGLRPPPSRAERLALEGLAP